MLVDTHAHLHFADFRDDARNVLSLAKENQVNKIINVGVNVKDSSEALDFLNSINIDGIELFATAGLHPHDAKKGDDELAKLTELVKNNRFIAIGECGLDYHRNLSDKNVQEKALRYQIDLALGNNLPLIFHVRDAWEDFFRVIKDYPKIRGVLHSFSATAKEVEKALKYDLFFGLNGIMTFTKDKSHIEAAELIPDNRLVLETDCPFLSPPPNRGKRNEPASVKIIAQFLANLRNQNYDELSKNTTKNAKVLFDI